MTCPYNPKIFCEYVNTSGMDKPVECKDCSHSIKPKPKEPKGLIQYVKWNTWQGLRFVKSYPLKEPASFNIIYKWTLVLGWFEIRKFLTSLETKRALKIFHAREVITDYDRKNIRRFTKMSTRKLRKLNFQDGKLYNGPELNRDELIYQLTFYEDAPIL
jgi:hypothetical protein